MNRRIIIADAGPLIALARIESLNLLRDLFRQVTITTQVRGEILPATSIFPDTTLLERALAEGWIDVVEAPPDDWKPLNPGIDPGEASAIRAARHWRDTGDAVLLIMDDRAGRLEAKAQGITLIGTAGVIGLAKTEALIPAAKPLLKRLTQTGYFIGAAVIQAVLEEVGE